MFTKKSQATQGVPCSSAQCYVLPVSLCLWLAIFLFLFLNLGNGSLRFWDEGLSAMRTLSMYEKGFSFTVYTLGTPDFNKPPLYYWMALPFYKLLGPSLLAVRLPSALMALGTFMLVWKMAGQLTKSAWGSIFACATLLFNAHWMNYARVGMLESSISFFLLAAIAFGGFSQYRHSLWGAAGTALLLAATAWLKHPLFGVFLLFFYLQWRFVDKTPQAGKRLLLASGIFILVGFFWHVQQYIVWGQQFITFFFKYNLVNRASEQIEGHQTSKLLFATPILQNTLLSFLLFLVSIPTMVSTWKEGGKERLLPVLVTTSIFVGMLFMTSKRRSHLTAWFPFMAVCAACGGQWVLQKGWPFVWQRLPLSRKTALQHITTFRHARITLVALLVLWNIGFVFLYKFTPDYTRDVSMAGRALLAENKLDMPVYAYARTPESLSFELRSTKQPLHFAKRPEEAVQASVDAPIRVLAEAKTPKGTPMLEAISQGIAGRTATLEFTTGDVSVFILSPEQTQQPTQQ